MQSHRYLEPAGFQFSGSMYLYIDHYHTFFLKVKPGELSVCYEAVAPEYPTIASQYQLVIPPRIVREKFKITIGRKPAKSAVDVENCNVTNKKTAKMPRPHLKSLSLNNIAIV